MKLTLDHIDQTIRNLGRLMPAKPNKNSTREYSLKESIFLMAPKLLEMRDMGFTSKELVSALADEEIVIKDATLNRYLCEYQKQSQGTTESNSEPASEAKPKRTADPQPNPAVGANHKQATDANINPAVGAESEQAATTKSERTTDSDCSYTDGSQSYPAKSATHDRQDPLKKDQHSAADQSAGKPKSSSWQTERSRDDDSGPV